MIMNNRIKTRLFSLSHFKMAKVIQLQIIKYYLFVYPDAEQIKWLSKYDNKETVIIRYELKEF